MKREACEGCLFSCSTEAQRHLLHGSTEALALRRHRGTCSTEAQRHREVGVAVDRVCFDCSMLSMYKPRCVSLLTYLFELQFTFSRRRIPVLEFSRTTYPFDIYTLISLSLFLSSHLHLPTDHLPQICSTHGNLSSLLATTSLVSSRLHPFSTADSIHPPRWKGFVFLLQCTLLFLFFGSAIAAILKKAENPRAADSH